MRRAEPTGIHPSAEMVCVGCGAIAPSDAPFACPRRGGDADVEHVLRRAWRGDPPESLRGDDDDNPFVRYRHLLFAYPFGRSRGLDDEALTGLVRELDAAVAALDGRGFRVTPLAEQPGLAAALELDVTLYTKDETRSPSGSHKGRHLMEVMTFLRVAERLGLRSAAEPLGIASCGNAALAGAVVAGAAGRALSVFIPTWADPNVVERLEALGAELVVCPRREGERGDPCTLRLAEAVAEAMVPFSCQGPDDGLAVVGGLTLGYELAEQLGVLDVDLDRLFIQVGGGALASACAQGLAEAHAWGHLPRLPRLHAVQTVGGYPLVRAWDRLIAHQLGLEPLADDLDTSARAARASALFEAGAAAVEGALEYARRHRSELMWPWETEPTSAATGILDDETYDWLGVVEGMLRSGGYPVAVDEADVARARVAVRAETNVVADATGTAGLAGAIHLGSRRLLDHDERVAVLLTGHDRTEERP